MDCKCLYEAVKNINKTKRTLITKEKYTVTYITSYVMIISVNPVSYTHLDVYKRQYETASPPIVGTAKEQQTKMV